MASRTYKDEVKRVGRLHSDWLAAMHTDELARRDARRLAFRAALRDVALLLFAGVAVAGIIWAIAFFAQ
jgi:hypothetical protein